MGIIRIMMNRTGITQAQIVKDLDLKISSFNRYFNEKASPKYDLMLDVADYCGYKVELKQKRKNSNIIGCMVANSQKNKHELAAEIGIKEDTLRQYINLKTTPTYDQFLKIAKACGYDVIISEKEEKDEKFGRD